MKLKKMPSEFQKALPVLKKLHDADYEAYFVGGSVRDSLLNRQIHDVDIATSAYPEETKHVFHRTVDIGIEHGTVLVLENSGEYEITTFRTEDVYVDYRRPSKVLFVRSLEEDLKRRDFTVNAFALAHDGTVIDKFSGLSDLDNHLLRAVGNPEERFTEDALRIMRGFRFSASLNFDIEKLTFKAMTENADLLEKISIERTFIELDKLLTAPYWKKGISYLLEAKANQFLPYLVGKKAFLSEMMTNLAPDFLFSSSFQAWAFLIISIKQKEVKSFLRSWKTSNDFQKMVSQLIKLYEIREHRSLQLKDLYQFGKALAYSVEELRLGQGKAVQFDRIDYLDDQLDIHHKHDIVVNGGDLMKAFKLKPGPKLGQLLKQVEEGIVSKEIKNTKESIFAFVTEELKCE